MLDEALRWRLLNALTEHDRRESKKKFYNPYALGQYCQALNRLERYVNAGHDLRLSMLNTFNGKLLDKMLNVANLPVSTKDEQWVGGFRQLPELEDE
jgi:hypothetical protein